MENLLRLWAIFIVTMKRLAAQRGMALATLLGIIAAISITMSIPIYADAAYQKIYNTELVNAASSGLLIANHPPYAFMFRYIGSWNGDIPLEDIRPVDSYLSGQAAVDIGLPPRSFVRYIDTGTFQLFKGQTRAYTNNNTLEWINFATVTGFSDKVTLEGRLPVGSKSPNAPVEALVSHSLAERLGLQVGQAYVAYAEVKNGTTTAPIGIPVVVAGIWTVKNDTDTYWFYGPSGYEKTLIVSAESLVNQVLPYLDNKISSAVWYWVMDGAKIHASEIPDLLGRIGSLAAFSEILLPKLGLDISPVDVLTLFEKSSNSLTVYLYAFSVPLLLMILVFIGLVVDMVVSQRRNEIAVLRSRGASTLQVTGMAVLESLLLSLVGLVVAIPISQVIVTFFSKAVSFLNFSAASQISATITVTGLRLGLLAGLVVTLAQVFPTIGAARHTIITYKQERARQSRRPFWQRAYLDVLLLIPAGYGFYQMQQQGSIVLPGMATSSDPFQNPLLLLVPALGIFAVTLFILRLLPYLMALLAWLMAKTSSVGVLMATRYLARTFSGYSAPLMLLMVTLSLATFTASLAQTLDHQVHDQTYYKVGADLNVVEAGKYAGQVIDPHSPLPQSSDNRNNFWVFPPVSDHLQISGVQAATRVGRYDVTVVAAGDRSGRVPVSFMGVDPAEFARVSFWREDFAGQSLESLMALLAATPNGVLVDTTDLASSGLNVGDALILTGAESGRPYQTDVKIVGTYTLFPTWYPGDAPMLVGNLDYLYQQIGGDQPHSVWLKTAPDADFEAMSAAIAARFNRILDSDFAPADVDKELLRPERQGFFGLLSVGFVALAVVTVLGFLLYALFSFRRRFIELGMLRAIGLSTRQMLLFLTSELGFLFLVGLGAGTGLGVGVSSLFIPLLQVGNKLADRVPPFLVRIDWPSVFQIYILFVLLFVGALAILSALLVRMKIFQAVKLGEAV